MKGQCGVVALLPIPKIELPRWNPAACAGVLAAQDSGGTNGAFLHAVGVEQRAKP